MPYIVQCFVEKPARRGERIWILTAKLYVVRRVFEQSNDRYLCGILKQPDHCIQRYVPGKRAAAVLCGSSG